MPFVRWLNVINWRSLKMPLTLMVRSGVVSRLAIAGFTIAKPDPRVERHPNYLVTLRYQGSHFDGAKRETVIEALRAEGIPVQPTYPYPLYRNPLFSDDGLPPCHCGAWHPAQEY